MGKVQDYLNKKKLEKIIIKTPKIFIVESNRNGVKLPKEYQVKEIKQNVSITTYSDGKKCQDNRYFLITNNFPYEVDISEGKTSTTIDGYGSGCGDLWEWTYFCSFSKENAENYYQKELKRVTSEYLKK